MVFKVRLRVMTGHRTQWEGGHVGLESVFAAKCEMAKMIYVHDAGLLIYASQI
jgi:hypothetical protein